MVLLDSHGISRVPRYLGYRAGVIKVLDTGLSPSIVGLSRPFSYPAQHSVVHAPQPRTTEAIRFGLLPVRSPLLRESLLFSLPQGT